MQLRVDELVYDIDDIIFGYLHHACEYNAMHCFLGISPLMFKYAQSQHAARIMLTQHMFPGRPHIIKEWVTRIHDNDWVAAYGYLLANRWWQYRPWGQVVYEEQRADYGEQTTVISEVAVLAQMASPYLTDLLDNITPEDDRDFVHRVITEEVQRMILQRVPFHLLQPLVHYLLAWDDALTAREIVDFSYAIAGPPAYYDYLLALPVIKECAWSSRRLHVLRDIACGVISAETLMTVNGHLMCKILMYNDIVAADDSPRMHDMYPLILFNHELYGTLPNLYYHILIRHQDVYHKYLGGARPLICHPSTTIAPLAIRVTLTQLNTADDVHAYLQALQQCIDWRRLHEPGYVQTALRELDPSPIIDLYMQFIQYYLDRPWLRCPAPPVFELWPPALADHNLFIDFECYRDQELEALLPDMRDEDSTAIRATSTAASIVETPYCFPRAPCPTITITFQGSQIRLVMLFPYQ